MKVRACDLGRDLGRVAAQGPVQVSGRVKRWHARSAPGAAAVAIDDAVEMKKAAQRFRDRRLNLRSAARPTRSTGTDASVTFRPLILTPAQRVSRS